MPVWSPIQGGYSGASRLSFLPATLSSYPLSPSSSFSSPDPSSLFSCPVSPPCTFYFLQLTEVYLIKKEESPQVPKVCAGVCGQKEAGGRAHWGPEYNEPESGGLAQSRCNHALTSQKVLVVVKFTCRSDSMVVPTPGGLTAEGAWGTLLLCLIKDIRRWDPRTVLVQPRALQRMVCFSLSPSALDIAMETKMNKRICGFALQFTTEP